MLKRLWNEEVGAIVSAEIMLVASILVIGVIVGLTSVRNAVVSELGDVAQSFANVNQTYSYSGVAGHHTYTAGAAYIDLLDFCDRPAQSDDVICDQNAKCVTICAAPSNPGGSTEGAL